MPGSSTPGPPGINMPDGLITGVAVYWCQAQLYRRLAVKRYDEISIA